jgi:GNAT superfamily N-acetyltransferase
MIARAYASLKVVLFQNLSKAVVTAMSIELRMVAPEDHGFLYSVYASTRADEMRLVNWDTRQTETFLRMQFGAQLAFYAEHYPNARYQIILLDGQRAGRLYTDWWASEIRIMDIALLPEYRGRGIGSTVLHTILEEARAINLPVTIHVERFNPALRWYAGLGFRQQEDKGVYLLMAWDPQHTERTAYVGQATKFQFSASPQPVVSHPGYGQ